MYLGFDTHTLSDVPPRVRGDEAIAIPPVRANAFPRLLQTSIAKISRTGGSQFRDPTLTISKGIMTESVARADAGKDKAITRKQVP